MEDPQEYKSLDDLFRKTFEELPESPSPSGWDAPSPRVWEQVQANIKPPKSGWTTQSLLLVAGMAVVLLLGLYWALTRPVLPDTDVQPVATEQPAVATTPAMTRTEAPVEAPTATAVMPARPTAPAPQIRRPDSRTQPTSLRPEAEQHPDAPGARQATGSIPLPGSAQAPNTTIRRQMEELRHAPWAQPLAPLPNILMILREKSAPSLPHGG